MHGGRSELAGQAFSGAMSADCLVRSSLSRTRKLSRKGDLPARLLSLEKQALVGTLKVSEAAFNSMGLDVASAGWLPTVPGEACLLGCP